MQRTLRGSRHVGDFLACRAIRVTPLTTKKSCPSYSGPLRIDGKREEGEPMARLGYLLPTRERIMEDRPRPRSLLALAERAEALGYRLRSGSAIRCWRGRATIR